MAIAVVLEGVMVGGIAGSADRNHLGGIEVQKHHQVVSDRQLAVRLMHPIEGSASALVVASIERVVVDPDRTKTRVARELLGMNDVDPDAAIGRVEDVVPDGDIGPVGLDSLLRCRGVLEDQIPLEDDVYSQSVIRVWLGLPNLALHSGGALQLVIRDDAVLGLDVRRHPGCLVLDLEGYVQSARDRLEVVVLHHRFAVVPEPHPMLARRPDGASEHPALFPCREHGVVRPVRQLGVDDVEVIVACHGIGITYVRLEARLEAVEFTAQDQELAGGAGPIPVIDSEPIGPTRPVKDEIHHPPAGPGGPGREYQSISIGGQCERRPGQGGVSPGSDDPGPGSQARGGECSAP